MIGNQIKKSDIRRKSEKLHPWLDMSGQDEYLAMNYNVKNNCHEFFFGIN